MFLKQVMILMRNKRFISGIQKGFRAEAKVERMASSPATGEQVKPAERISLIRGTGTFKETIYLILQQR